MENGKQELRCVRSLLGRTTTIALIATGFLAAGFVSSLWFR
jgi:hypothetical protein